MLVSQQRYDLVLEKFPNLAALAQAVPEAEPKGFNQYPPAVQELLTPRD